MIGCGLLCASSAMAQQALASAGGEGSGGGLHVAWSIGEPIIATGTSANIVVTQGFHQPPTDFSTVIIPVADNDEAWQLFPNPTRDALHLITTDAKAAQAMVINALGQRVALWPIQSASATWSVETLASGAYHLRVLDNTGAELHTFEFIVTQ